MQTPHCYCGCSVLSFFLFRFPTEICTRFSSVKTRMIDFKLLHNVQNGLIRVPTFFGNLAYSQTNYSSFRFPPDAPVCERLRVASQQLL